MFFLWYNRVCNKGVANFNQINKKGENMTDYNYYISKFNGQKITNPDDFYLNFEIALKYVNNAVSKDATHSDILDAACAVCEFVSENDPISYISKETADGVSVSYDNSAFNKKIHTLIELYVPQKLLYRGLN